MTSDKCQTVSSKVRVRRDYYAIVKQTVHFEETNCCFSPIGCEFWILFNRCCIYNYIKNSVLLYSTSSIHGTLRSWGGHWNQRFLAWNHGRWRSRLLVNRLPELVVSVGWNSGVLVPWDWPQGISKPIPIWPSILGKVVERCEKRCHDCAQVLGAPLESIMPNAWVEREGNGSAATVLRVGWVTIGGKLQRVYSMLRGSYLLMWQCHSKYCASFVNPSRSDSWLSGQ